MSAYVNHILMSLDTLKRNNLKVDENYMSTFSLGGDLTKGSKIRYATHHERQDEFINNMANYIKTNNLYNDKKYIGCLYAHICHYVMDNNIHPLIRKVNKESINIGRNNHTLTEVYYDIILINKKFNLKYSKFKTRKYLMGDTNKVKDMIDYAYKETYGYDKISVYYKLNLFLYRFIRIIFFIPGVYLMTKFSKYDKFIKVNKEKMRDNEYFKLYDKSIMDANEYIERINLEYFKIER